MRPFAPVAPVPGAADRSPIAVCVEEVLRRRAEYLECAATHESPLYLLDTASLRQRASRFREAFAAELPDVRVYYALKSNNHPTVLRTLVNEGLGIDVSSGVELAAALAAGATDIVFSGPGKTNAELDQAVSVADRVVVLVDSLGELERLQHLAAAADRHVRIGARVSTSADGLWRKFGIPLGQLRAALEAASACPNLVLCGLQYHMSWSLDPSRQVAFLQALGSTLEGIPPHLRRNIGFLDIGGGFWPEEGEWVHADPESMMRGGTALARAGASPGIPGTVPEPSVRPASDIDQFASAIGAALRGYVFPHIECRVHVEPGRWLCNDAMSVLITVVDKKADDLVIVDAGTNAIGWERYESDYFPLVNLTRPSRDEQLCAVFGSLCTPHDIWGFSYHGTGIETGDVLVVPRQGAYTYSLRQLFIKPLPEVVVLDPRERRP